jgi:hypothetical protein
MRTSPAHLAVRVRLHPVLARPLGILCARGSLPLHALLCRIHIIQQLGLGLGLHSTTLFALRALMTVLADL